MLGKINNDGKVLKELFNFLVIKLNLFHYLHFEGQVYHFFLTMQRITMK